MCLSVEAIQTAPMLFPLPRLGGLISPGQAVLVPDERHNAVRKIFGDKSMERREFPISARRAGHDLVCRIMAITRVLVPAQEVNVRGRSFFRNWLIFASSAQVNARPPTLIVGSAAFMAAATLL